MTAPASYNVHDQPRFEAGPPSDWPYWCAMDLLTHPVDEAISRQLTRMGKAEGVNRAWMLEYSPDLLRFRNTHEWCKDQTKPFVNELQEAPVTLIAWLHRYMVKGQTVAVHNVNHLPHAARAIRAEFLRQSDKSVLSAPLFHGKELRGIIGFDTTTAYKTWSVEQIHALQQCANLIGQAKYAGHNHRSGPSRETYATPLIYLSMHGLTRGVQPKSIIGVRSSGNYSKIWLDDETVVLDSRPFGMWSALLPATYFQQVHRTAIINALHVIDIDRRLADKWSVTMRSVQHAWPVSRQFRKALRERMGI